MPKLRQSRIKKISRPGVVGEMQLGFPLPSSPFIFHNYAKLISLRSGWAMSCGLNVAESRFWSSHAHDPSFHVYPDMISPQLYSSDLHNSSDKGRSEPGVSPGEQVASSHKQPEQKQLQPQPHGILPLKVSS